MCGRLTCCCGGGGVAGGGGSCAGGVGSLFSARHKLNLRKQAQHIRMPVQTF